MTLTARVSLQLPARIVGVGGTTVTLTDGTYYIESGALGGGDLGDISIDDDGVATVTNVDLDAIEDASATNLFLARVSSGSGPWEEASSAQATAILDQFTSTTKGLAPLSGGGTVNFLRADGTWTNPGGGGLSDGDKGDVTVSGSGATWTIDNDAVTFAKMQNIATDRLLGRDTAASGNVEEISLGTGLSWTGSAGIQVTPNQRLKTITAIFDGGGSVLTTGIKGDLEVPYDCTIVQATLLADQSGSVVVDIWKDTYANYPPADADSITDITPPTISGATKSQNTALGGWTVSVAAGDILRFNIDSVSTITRLTLSLTVSVT